MSRLRSFTYAVLGACAFETWTVLRLLAWQRDRGFQLRVPLWVAVTLQGTITATCLYWALRTVQRLLLPALSAPSSDIVHHHGVLKFGGFLSAAMAGFFAIRNRTSMGAPWGPLEALAYHFVLAAIVMVPTSLWAGRFWGQSMQQALSPPKR